MSRLRPADSGSEYHTTKEREELVKFAVYVLDGLSWFEELLFPPNAESPGSNRIPRTLLRSGVGLKLHVNGRVRSAIPIEFAAADLHEAPTEIEAACSIILLVNIDL